MLLVLRQDFHGLKRPAGSDGDAPLACCRSAGLTTALRPTAVFTPCAVVPVERSAELPVLVRQIAARSVRVQHCAKFTGFSGHFANDPAPCGGCAPQAVSHALFSKYGFLFFSPIWVLLFQTVSSVEKRAVPKGCTFGPHFRTWCPLKGDSSQDGFGTDSESDLAALMSCRRRA